MQFSVATVVAALAVVASANPYVGRRQLNPACTTAYNACRVAPNANMAFCASSYAGCLGFNPFDNSGSLNTTQPANIAYTTTVVTAYTTYCPAATTLVFNGKTYVATGPTTITITNCPCTITTPVVKPATTVVVVAPTTAAPKTTVVVPAPAPSTKPATATTAPVVTPAKTTTPVVYTGAAVANKVGGVVVAAGIAAALL